MTKSIYSVEIMLAATVYVVAENEADAVQQVQAFHMDGGEMSTRNNEFIAGLPVSGARYDDPDFPEISISPAVTVYAENLAASHVEDISEDDSFDNGRAFEEGWGIFQASGDGRYYIDADDEAPSRMFVGAADDYVQHRADEGSLYHKAALEWIEAHN